MIMYLKSYENDSANFLNYENFLSCRIEVKSNECLCRLKAGSHIIAAIVSIAAVNSKSGLTIGTII